MVKRVLQSGDHAEASAAFLKAQSFVDRLASKGVIHRNKAARYKRQMERRMQGLASA